MTVQSSFVSNIINYNPRNHTGVQFAGAFAHISAAQVATRVRHDVLELLRIFLDDFEVDGYCPYDDHRCK